MLEYFFFPHHKHKTPKGWRVRREGSCWLVRNLLWCSPDWYWLTLLNTSYCVVVTTVIHKLWINELTGWIFSCLLLTVQYYIDAWPVICDTLDLGCLLLSVQYYIDAWPVICDTLDLGCLLLTVQYYIYAWPVICDTLDLGCLLLTL